MTKMCCAVAALQYMYYKGVLSLSSQLCQGNDTNQQPTLLDAVFIEMD